MQRCVEFAGRTDIICTLTRLHHYFEFKTFASRKLGRDKPKVERAAISLLVLTVPYPYLAFLGMVAG